MVKDKSAAILTIKDASMLTPTGRKALVAWLRKQAHFLDRHSSEYASRFTARYLYK